MGPAWDVLGTLRPALARSLGLRPELQIHVGAHDSNVCLARWLRRWPQLTLISSGTWVVIMAPGAQGGALAPESDELGNVSVRGELVPTARFMGGRELRAICGDADPRLANSATLEALIARGLQVMPTFSSQGGPFQGRQGQVLIDGGRIFLAGLSPVERATAAALHAAKMTVLCVERLGGAAPGRTVLLEGPLAGNPLVVSVLAALLPRGSLRVACGTQEGTVVGTFMLSHWTRSDHELRASVSAGPPLFAAQLRAHYRCWLAMADVEAPYPSSGTGWDEKPSTSTDH